MIFKKSKYLKLFTLEISYQLLEKFFRIFLGIFIIYRLSSYLGPAQYGSLLFIESNYLFFLGLSGFGLKPQIIKIFSQKKQNWENHIYNSLCLSVIISTCFFLMFNIWNFYFLKFNLKGALFYVSLLLFLNPIYFIEHYFSSLNKIRYNSLISTISYLICFLLKVIAIENGLDFIFFIGIIILEALLKCLFLTVLLLKGKTLSIKNFYLDMSVQFQIFKNSFFIFLYGLGINLFSRIDILMIEEFLSLEDLGNYTGSYKIVSFLYAFPIILADTFYPKILKLKDMSFSQKKMYFVAFWSSAILFFIILIFKRYLLERLFDGQFDTVQVLFQISVIPVLIMGLSSVYVKELYKKNLQINLFKRSIFGIFINVVLNFILLKMHGVIGVAYATVISILVLEIFYDFFDKKTRKYHISKLRSIFDFRILKNLI